MVRTRKISKDETGARKPIWAAEVASTFANLSRFAIEFSRGRTFLALLTAIYIGCLALLAWPAIAYPVGADDAYWILAEPSNVNNSIFQAYTQSLADAFTFEGQPRTTALATGERRALAIVAMNFATTFSVPPAVPWAFFKIAWLVFNFAALALFLYRLRFRGAEGQVRGLSRTAIISMLAIFPITLTLGIEMETVGLTNGWIFYPNLTYLPFGVYLLTAVLLTELEGPVRRSPVVWGPPSFLVVGILAFALSLQYELMALAVPIGVLALVLKPSEGGTWWLRWRAKLMLGGAFGGTYTAVFLWTRWQISKMACQLDGSCYQGNVIQIDPGTIFRNFTASLPGPGFQAALDAGAVVFDSRVFWLSLLIGGVGTTVALWIVALRLRRQRGSATDLQPSSVREDLVDDRRGLFIIALFMFVIIAGSTVITGMTERAVERLVEPISSYRVGVIIWSAMSVVLVAAGLYTLTFVRGRARVRKLMVIPTVLVAGLIAVSAGLALWNNLRIIDERFERPTQRALAEIHWEVALGDTRRSADEARCELLDRYWNSFNNPAGTGERTVRGAQRAFQLYHGQPFCTEGTPMLGSP